MTIRAPYLAILLAVTAALITSACKSDEPPSTPPPSPPPDEVIIIKRLKHRPKIRDITLQEAILRSPTLDSDMAMLKLEGWQFVNGISGLSYTHSGNKKIIELSSDVVPDPIRTLQALSHEVGHAKSGIHTNPIEMTREEYVDAKLLGEGAAVMNSILVQRESHLHFNLTLGVGNTELYYAIYEAYFNGEISENAARRQIGEVFRNKEFLDPDGNMSYGRFYGEQWDWYQQQWEKHKQRNRLRGKNRDSSPEE